MHIAESQLRQSLQEYFGFDTFKGDQEKIIQTILRGQDTFVLMPTGGGKSLCYQLPAILSEGTAVVISPLIALMKNQVDLVRGYSGKDSIAHFYNSSLTTGQKNAVKQDVRDGHTKLLYIAPETFSKPNTVEFLKSVGVSFIAIDEAHCISEWGHDFRPEYRRIREIIGEIDDNIPQIALTATATPKVQSDIVKTLKLDNPEIFISSFNRSNLYFEFRPKRSENGAIKNIIQYIKQHEGKSGIIYATNRKTTEKVAEMLNINGIKAAPYHAGLDSAVRSKSQDGFLMEDYQVIVATIAFGMGIDKPDIRFVIHYDLPKSLENYYQETGRSGRDGMEGNCVVYFSYKDISKIEHLLRDKSVAEKERAIQLLDEMVSYAETSECRRKFLLHYFGEFYDDDGCNKMCDNCRNPREKVDVSDDTLMALEAIGTLGEKHKITHVVNVLTGNASKEVLDFKHNQSKYFAAGKEKDEHHWNAVIRHCLIHNVVSKDIEDYGILKLTDKAREFIASPTKVSVAVNHNYEEEANDIITTGSNGSVLDPALLDMLKGLRKTVAKQHNLPTYVIFQDASLDEMATKYPITSEEFGNIVGVSKGKAQRYGKQFSEMIKNYVEDNDIDRPEDFVVKTVAKKSGNKVKIIQMIDRKQPLDEIADDLRINKEDLIAELETIVNSGTKLNIDYYLEDNLDQYLVEDIFDYFKTAESDSIDDAWEEFQEDEIEVEDIQLVRIKFISDLAN